MPPTGVPYCEHEDILRYEELLCIAEAAISLGIEKIRITGGEPLVRKGLLDFLKRLRVLPGLSELTLTTNGLLLEETAEQLKAVGVNRINVSLDSLDPQTYEQITHGGDVERVLTGLKAAEQAGLPLKLNMVVMRGINDHEIKDFAAVSQKHPWSVRFIEYMPTLRELSWPNRMVPGGEILERLCQSFTLSPISSSRLCGPSKSYRIESAIGTVGIITPMSEPFCSDCNRIRVTAQGLAKGCLLSNQTFDLKPTLTQGMEAVRAALSEVISGKNLQHHFVGKGRSFQMSRIGG